MPEKPMRRTVVVMALLAAAVAGVLAYYALATEREFDRLIAEGDRAVAVDRPFQAIEAYSGAVAIRPDSMVAHFKRGAVYQSRGELQSALRDLRRAVELDPTAPQPLELSGDVNAALGRHERAAEDYEASLALDERNARVLYKLGLARYRAGGGAAAVAPLRQAAALDSSMGEAFYLLGLALRDEDQLADARAALDEVLKRAPAHAAAHEALSEVYALAGNAAKSIDHLETLAALEPSRPERLVAVGLAQAAAGRQDAAVLTLSRAVDRFPDAPQTYAALGHVWLGVARARADRVALRKAVEALVEAANRSDATSDTLADLGRAWLLAGDPAAAERAFRQAVSRLPVRPQAFQELARLAERNGRIQDARDALVKYATLVGDTQPLAEVAIDIADLSMRLGEPSTAVRWYGRALDEAGPSGVLMARLADAALKAGDVARARQVIDEGLAADPGDRTLQQLRRRLAAADPARP
jgi:tetratricopeptide (TPR) repeat protein